MNLRPSARPRKHRALTALGFVAAAVAVAFVVVAVAAWLSFRSWSATAEEVARTSPGGRTVVSVLPFHYRGRTRFLEIPISAAEVAAARRLRTDEVFAQPALLRDVYLRALVGSQSRSGVVEEVARQLRAIRVALRLDSDEYVELMTASVQDVTYGEPESAFQLPVDALATRRGVCVDRSLLLAALLVHEGYDAGLWTLGSRDHVAVALRGSSPGYQGSGYTYIETTRRAYVGEVPEKYALMTASEPRPRLVVLGRGERYRADAQTALIVDERRRAELLARGLGPYATYTPSSRRWRELYEREARRALAASSLATQLAECVDDRDLAFATLESLNGWDSSGRL